MAHASLGAAEAALLAVDVSYGTALLPSPLKRLPWNVNTEAAPVFLWARTEGAGAPIVDIVVLHGEEAAPEGYKKVARDLSGGTAAPEAKAYLAYKTATADEEGAGAPIVGLQVLPEGAPLDAGYVLVDTKGRPLNPAPGAQRLQLAIKHCSSESDANAAGWAEGLKVGDTVDFYARDKTWRVARISAVEEGNPGTLTITLRGWTAKHDEVVERGSKRLARAGTHTALTGKGGDHVPKGQGGTFDVDLDVLDSLEMKINDYISGDFPVEERERFARQELPGYMSKVLSSRYGDFGDKADDPMKPLRDRIFDFLVKVMELVLHHVTATSEPLPVECRKHLSRLFLDDKQCDFFFQHYGGTSPGDEAAKTTDGWAAVLPASSASRYFVMNVNQFYEKKGYDAVLERLRSTSAAAAARLAVEAGATSADSGNPLTIAAAIGAPFATVPAGSVSSFAEDDPVADVAAYVSAVYIPRFVYTKQWALKYYQPLRDGILERLELISDAELRKANKDSILETARRLLDLYHCLVRRFVDEPTTRAILAGPEGAGERDGGNPYAAFDRFYAIMAPRFLRLDSLALRIRAVGDVSAFVEAVEAAEDDGEGAGSAAAASLLKPGAAGKGGLLNARGAARKNARPTWFTGTSLTQYLVSTRLLELALGGTTGAPGDSAVHSIPVHEQTMARLGPIIHFLGIRTQKAHIADTLRETAGAENVSAAAAASAIARGGINERHVNLLFDALKGCGRGDALGGVVLAVISEIVKFIPLGLMDSVYARLAAIPAAEWDASTVALVKSFAESALKEAGVDRVRRGIGAKKRWDAAVAAAKEAGKPLPPKPAEAEVVMRGPDVKAFDPTSHRSFFGLLQLLEVACGAAAGPEEAAAAAAGTAPVEPAREAVRAAAAEAVVELCTPGNSCCQRDYVLDRCIGHVVSGRYVLPALTLARELITRVPPASMDVPEAYTLAPTLARLQAKYKLSQALVGELVAFKLAQLEGVKAARSCSGPSGEEGGNRPAGAGATSTSPTSASASGGEASPAHGGGAFRALLAAPQVEAVAASLRAETASAVTPLAATAGAWAALFAGPAKAAETVLTEQAKARLDFVSFLLATGALTACVDDFRALWCAFVQGALVPAERDVFFMWLASLVFPAFAAKRLGTEETPAWADGTTSVSAPRLPASLVDTLFKEFFCNPKRLDVGAAGHAAYVCFEAFFRYVNGAAERLRSPMGSNESLQLVVSPSATPCAGESAGGLTGISIVWATALHAAEATAAREAAAFLIAIFARVTFSLEALKAHVVAANGGGEAAAHETAALSAKLREAYWHSFVSECVSRVQAGAEALPASSSSSSSASTHTAVQAAHATTLHWRRSSRALVERGLYMLVSFISAVEGSAGRSRVGGAWEEDLRDDEEFNDSVPEPELPTVMSSTGRFVKLIPAEGKAQADPAGHMEQVTFVLVKDGPAAPATSYASAARNNTITTAFAIEVRPALETLSAVRHRIAAALQLEAGTLYLRPLVRGESNYWGEEDEELTLAEASVGAFAVDVIESGIATEADVRAEEVADTSDADTVKAAGLRARARRSVPYTARERIRDQYLRAAMLNEVSGGIEAGAQAFAADVAAEHALRQAVRAPRVALSANRANADFLFSLLSHPSPRVVEAAWALLQAVPVSVQTELRLHTLGGRVEAPAGFLTPAAAEAAAAAGVSTPVPWSELFDASSPALLLYSLQIVGSILERLAEATPADSPAEADTPSPAPWVGTEWLGALVSGGGLAHLLQVFYDMDLSVTYAPAASPLHRQAMRQLTQLLAVIGTGTVPLAAAAPSLKEAAAALDGDVKAAAAAQEAKVNAALLNPEEAPLLRAFLLPGGERVGLGGDRPRLARRLLEALSFVSTAALPVLAPGGASPSSAKPQLTVSDAAAGDCDASSAAAEEGDRPDAAAAGLRSLLAKASATPGTPSRKSGASAAMRSPGRSPGGSKLAAASGARSALASSGFMSGAAAAALAAGTSSSSEDPDSAGATIRRLFGADDAEEFEEEERRAASAEEEGEGDPLAATQALLLRLLHALAIGLEWLHPLGGSGAAASATFVAPGETTALPASSAAAPPLAPAALQAITSAPHAGAILATACMAPRTPVARDAAQIALLAMALLPAAGGVCPRASLAQALADALPLVYVFPAACGPFIDTLCLLMDGSIAAAVPAWCADASASDATAAALLGTVATAIASQPLIETGGETTDPTDEVLAGFLKLAIACVKGRTSLPAATVTSLAHFVLEACLFPPNLADAPLARKTTTRSAAFECVKTLALTDRSLLAAIANRLMAHHDGTVNALASGTVPRAAVTWAASAGPAAASGDTTVLAVHDPSLADAISMGRQRFHAALTARRTHILTGSRGSTGYVGLKNLGCICYMNSTIQQFFMTPAFRAKVMSWVEPATSEAERRDSLMYQMQRQFAFLQDSTKQAYVPVGLCHAIKDWDGNPTNIAEQKDVPEFLTKLFSDMETQCQGSPLASLARDVFGGHTQQELIAEDPRPGADASHKLYRARADDFNFIQVKVKGNANLHQALAEYVAGETVDFKWEDLPPVTTQATASSAASAEEDATGGGAPSSPAAAPGPTTLTLKTTKRTSLQSCGDMLMLHLNRFEFDFDTMQQVKLNDRFEFPETLDLWPYTVHGRADRVEAAETAAAGAPTRADFQYRLVGVVIHLGSAHAGHYYSYIRERDGRGGVGDWFEFNDANVSKWEGTPAALERDCFGGPVSTGGRTLTRSANAFCLLYERIKETPASSGAAAAVPTLSSPSGGAAALTTGRLMPAGGSGSALVAVPAPSGGAVAAVSQGPALVSAFRGAMSASGAGKSAAIRAAVRCPVPAELAATIAQDNAGYALVSSVFSEPYFRFMQELVAALVAPTLPSEAKGASPLGVRAFSTDAYSRLPSGGKGYGSADGAVMGARRATFPLLEPLAEGFWPSNGAEALAAATPLVRFGMLVVTLYVNTAPEMGEAAVYSWTGLVERLVRTVPGVAVWWLQSLMADPVDFTRRMTNFLKGAEDGNMFTTFVTLWSLASVWHHVESPTAAAAGPAPQPGASIPPAPLLLQAAALVSANAGLIAAGGGIFPAPRGGVVSTFLSFLLNLLPRYHVHWLRHQALFEMLHHAASIDVGIARLLVTLDAPGKLANYQLQGDTPSPQLEEADPRFPLPVDRKGAAPVTQSFMQAMVLLPPEPRRGMGDARTLPDLPPLWRALSAVVAGAAAPGPLAASSDAPRLSPASLAVVTYPPLLRHMVAYIDRPHEAAAVAPFFAFLVKGYPAPPASIISDCVAMAFDAERDSQEEDVVMDTLPEAASPIAVLCRALQRTFARSLHGDEYQVLFSHVAALLDAAGDGEDPAASGASLQAARVDFILRFFVASIHAGRAFYVPTDRAISHFIKLAKGRPLVKAWMAENAEELTWMLTWIDRTATPPPVHPSTAAVAAPPPLCAEGALAAGDVPVVYSRGKVPKPKTFYGHATNASIHERELWLKENVRDLLAGRGDPQYATVAGEDDDPLDAVGRTVSVFNTQATSCLFRGQVQAYDAATGKHTVFVSDNSDLAGTRYLMLTAGTTVTYVLDRRPAPPPRAGAPVIGDDDDDDDDTESDGYSTGSGKYDSADDGEARGAAAPAPLKRSPLQPAAAPAAAVPASRSVPSLPGLSSSSASSTPYAALHSAADDDDDDAAAQAGDVDADDDDLEAGGYNDLDSDDYDRYDLGDDDDDDAYDLDDADSATRAALLQSALERQAQDSTDSSTEQLPGFMSAAAAIRRTQQP